MNNNKQYVSRIKLEDGSILDIKDQEVRDELESLFTDTIILDCGTYTNYTGIETEEQ